MDWCQYHIFQGYWPASCAEVCCCHRGHSYYWPPFHSHGFRRLPIPGLTTSLWGSYVNSPISPWMTQTLLCTMWTWPAPPEGNGEPAWGSDETDSGPESSAHVRKAHLSTILRGQPGLHVHRDPEETERKTRPVWKVCDRWGLSAPRLTATASEVTDASEGVGVLCAHPAAPHCRRASVPAMTVCAPPLWLLDG